MMKPIFYKAAICGLGFYGFAAGLAVSTPSFAEESTWSDLKDTVYGQRLMTVSPDVVKINTPYRTRNDARTQISAAIDLPAGRKLENVTVFVDENPMPVSAKFDFARPVPRFSFDVTMRINGPTPVHIVATAENGQLFVADSFVKTSGQGACAAPPGTNPEEALATLGNMELDIKRPGRLASITQNPTQIAQTDQDQAGTIQFGQNQADKKIDLKISHPSHSGMQMDQISLLYIPIRYVETIDVKVNEQPFVQVTGSVSLSENPQLSMTVPASTRSVSVQMTDTSQTVTTASKSLADF